MQDIQLGLLPHYKRDFNINRGDDEEINNDVGVYFKFYMFW